MTCAGYVPLNIVNITCTISNFIYPCLKLAYPTLGNGKACSNIQNWVGGICWVLGSVKETLWQKKSPSLLGSIFATCWGFCSPTPEPQNSENTSLGKDAGFMDDKPHLWNVCFLGDEAHALYKIHINKYSLVYKQLPNIYYIYTCKFCLHNSHYRLCSRRLGVLCPSVEVWNCQEGFDQRNVGLTPSDHSEFLQVPIGLVQ